MNSADSLGLAGNDDVPELLNQIQADIKNLRKNGVGANQHIDTLERQIESLQKQVESLTKNNQQLNPDVEKQLRDMILKTSTTLTLMNINVVGGVGVNNGTVIINNGSGGAASATNEKPANVISDEAKATAIRICEAQSPIYVQKCLLGIVGLYFDAGALKICEGFPWFVDKQNCMLKVKNKTYDPLEIKACLRNYAFGEQMGCLVSHGKSI